MIDPYGIFPVLSVVIGCQIIQKLLFRHLDVLRLLLQVNRISVVLGSQWADHLHSVFVLVRDNWQALLLVLGFQ